MPDVRRTRAVLGAARRVSGASSLAVAILVTEASAWGAPREHAVVHLSYTRDKGAEQCPDEGALREAVLARLGYDPFDDHAPRVLSARVSRSRGRTGGSLVAHIELRDAAGAPQGERDLSGEGGDCTELATAMAIAISLGIDPLAAVSPRTPAPPPPAPVVSPPAPPPAPVVSPPAPPPAPAPLATPPGPPGPAVHARFGVGAMLSWGISPAFPAVGGTVDAGLRRGAWSLDLEGAGNWSATATDGAAGVKSSLVLASLLPCLHLGWGVGCVVGGVGALSATGVVRSPQSGNALYADAGVRLGAEIPIAQRFFVRAYADGLAALKHVSYIFDGQNVWSTPPFSASLGVAAGFEL